MPALPGLDSKTGPTEFWPETLHHPAPCGPCGFCLIPWLDWHRGENFSFGLIRKSEYAQFTLPDSQTPNWERIGPGLFPLLKLPDGDSQGLAPERKPRFLASGALWTSPSKDLLPDKISKKVPGDPSSTFLSSILPCLNKQTSFLGS